MDIDLRHTPPAEDDPRDVELTLQAPHNRVVKPVGCDGFIGAVDQVRASWAMPHEPTPKGRP